MADSSLIKKLLIKGGQKIAVINPPPGYSAQLSPLPAGAEITDKLEAPPDTVQLFVKNSRELEHFVPMVMKAIISDGILWISYPKGSSKVETDLNRDVLWERMKKFGLVGVAMVSVDNVWAAMRFRPAEKASK